MKIEIEYNGSFAICLVSGYVDEDENGTLTLFNRKPFKECDRMTQILVLDAFRTIEENYKRDLRNNCNNASVDETVLIHVPSKEVFPKGLK